MSEDAPNPLELATEADLVEELARRNDAVVVTLLRPTKKASERADEISSYNRGGFTRCLGLAVRIAECFKTAAVRKSQYIEEDGKEGGE